MTYRSREAFKNSGVWISPSMQLFYFLAILFVTLKNTRQHHKPENLSILNFQEYLSFETTQKGIPSIDYKKKLMLKKPFNSKPRCC